MNPIAGRHNLTERNLEFDLGGGFDFAEPQACFQLSGENGIGKTSFLEKILIPALEAESLPYLYIGQDLRTQLFTLRALMAVLGHRVPDKDDLGVFKTWITRSRTARMLILDEFDKYVPDPRMIFDWSRDFIETYVFVTHLGNGWHSGIPEAVHLRRVRFDRVDSAGTLRRVQVTGAVP